MSEIFTRRTERRADLPDGLEARLSKRYDEGKLFRPDRVIEGYWETSSGTKIYTVEFSGPVQTKTGKDHAASRGQYEYTSRSGYGDKPIRDIPRELATFIIGAAAMRDVLDGVAVAVD